MWRFGFFDAVETAPGIYDRVYNAEEFSVPFSALIDTGVLEGAGDSLEVTTDGSSMQTTIGTGVAFIRGRYAENTSRRAHTHDTETVGADRIDRIVIRLDLRPEARHVESFVKKGVASTNPAPPALQRDENVYEISLAQVYIRGGQSFIDPADITDERGDEDVCPWARSKVLPSYDQQDLDDLRNEFDEHKAKIATETEYGHVRLQDIPKGKKVARFVIGTFASGWTQNDVDYLCDGVDDQEEINAAIQALPVSGGEIIILDGTYNITAPINVNKSNVSIKGNGNATVLKRMWNSGSIEGVITLDSVSNCKIENLQIDGNKSVYTSSNNYGIYLSSSSNNTVTGNTFNNNSNGISIFFSSNNNTITGNTCNNNDYGIFLSTSSNNNTITGNTCDNNGARGISLISSSNNNTITGNTCNNNNEGISLVSSNNNTITGNTCNNNNEGIYLSSSSNNTVTGNTCIRGTGQSSDYTSSQYTIRLAGSGNSYNLISSNNCMGKDVVIEGGTSNTSINNKYN